MNACICSKPFPARSLAKAGQFVLPVPNGADGAIAVLAGAHYVDFAALLQKLPHLGLDLIADAILLRGVGLVVVSLHFWSTVGLGAG